MSRSRSIRLAKAGCVQPDDAASRGGEHDARDAEFDRFLDNPLQLVGRDPRLHQRDRERRLAFHRIVTGQFDLLPARREPAVELAALPVEQHHGVAFAQAQHVRGVVRHVRGQLDDGAGGEVGLDEEAGFSHVARPVKKKGRRMPARSSVSLPPQAARNCGTRGVLPDAELGGCVSSCTKSGNVNSAWCRPG